MILYGRRKTEKASDTSPADSRSENIGETDLKVVKAVNV